MEPPGVAERDPNLVNGQHAPSRALPVLSLLRIPPGPVTSGEMVLCLIHDEEVGLLLLDCNGSYSHLVILHWDVLLSLTHTFVPGPLSFFSPVGVPIFAVPDIFENFLTTAPEGKIMV